MERSFNSYNLYFIVTINNASLSLWKLPEGRMVLSVSDTGIGIPPIAQSKIFQEFWQVDQSRSQLQGGSGLGLAISKEIVALMQGSLSVTSKPGEGSTFRVELPRVL